MTCYMFQLSVQAGKLDRLRQLNEEYQAVLDRAAAAIPGLHGIEKWLLGQVYVERVDFDGEFADFARQLTADKDVRQFLRSVGECFVEPLRDMAVREMSCLQALPG